MPQLCDRRARPAARDLLAAPLPAPEDVEALVTRGPALVAPLGTGAGGWTRRTWLTQTAQQAAALVVAGPLVRRRPGVQPAAPGAATAATAATAGRADPAAFEALARQAVAAATAAGAQYADAKLTRTVRHHYEF